MKIRKNQKKLKSSVKYITKKDIVESFLLTQVGIDMSKKRGEEFIVDLFEFINTKLQEGNEVKIAPFGKFVLFTNLNGHSSVKFRSYKKLKGNA